MIFLRNNIWRILPFGIAILIWAIGYILRWHAWDVGICESWAGHCAEVAQGAVGDPMLGYGQWLIASAVIMLFARLETLKRWSIFAIVYLAATTVVLAFTQVSAGGIGFPERLTVAHLFGIVFLIITVLWVVIHTIILRRRERELRI